MSITKKSSWESFQDVLNTKKIVEESMNRIETIVDFFYQAINDSTIFSRWKNEYLTNLRLKIDENHKKFLWLNHSEIKELDKLLWDYVLLHDEIDSVEKLKSKFWIEKEDIKNIDLEQIWIILWITSIEFWKSKLFNIEFSYSTYWARLEITFPDMFLWKEREVWSMRNYLWRIINSLNDEFWINTYNFSLESKLFHDRHIYNNNHRIYINVLEKINSSDNYYEENRLRAITKKDNCLSFEKWFYKDFMSYWKDWIFYDKKFILWTSDNSKYQKLKLSLWEIKNMIVVWNEKSWKTTFVRNLLTSFISCWWLNDSDIRILDLNSNKNNYQEFQFLNNLWNKKLNIEKWINQFWFYLKEEINKRRELIKKNFIKDNTSIKSLWIEERVSIWLRNIIIVIDWAKLNRENSDSYWLIKDIIVKEKNSFLTLDKLWIHFIVISSTYKWKQYLIKNELIDSFETKVTFKNTKDWYNNIFNWKWLSSLNLIWFWDWVIQFWWKENMKHVLNKNQIISNFKIRFIRFQSSFITNWEIESLLNSVQWYIHRNQEIENLSSNNIDI